MKTTKLGILTLAGLAVSALAVSTPSWARDYNDYPRHVAYERDYRAEYDRRHFGERHRFGRRPHVVVERPVYVEQAAPVYNPPAQGSLGAIIGGMIGAIVGDRVTDGR